MSLMKCPSCSRDVSYATARCQQCGHPIVEKRTANAEAITVFIIGVALGLMWLASHPGPQPPSSAAPHDHPTGLNLEASELFQQVVGDPLKKPMARRPPASFNPPPQSNR